MKHGTIGAYTYHRCRCDECRAAWRDYCKRQRERRIDRPIPDEVRHGASAYQEWNCRCDVCVAARAAWIKPYRDAYRARTSGAEPPRHGTRTAYSDYACRCDLCRQANTDYYRQRRQAKRASRDI